MIYINYKNIFEGKKKSSNDFSTVSLNPAFNNHHIIHTIIKELNSTIEDVYQMTYISVLNWLSYFKNIDEINEYNSKKNK